MENAPFFEDVADGPKGGAAYWLRADDGVRVRVVHWPLEKAKGTVLLFPGRTEYAEKYGRAATEYQSRGYALVAVDWRGQGIADRLTSIHGLGHVGKFSDYQLDVDAVVASLRQTGMPEPYFLVAHSMGGCIGLRALQNHLPVKAAAFSAPMWGVSIAQPLRTGAWLIGTVGPLIGLGERVSPGRSTENYVEESPFEGNELTNDPEMFTYMRDQLAAHPDLGLGGPSINWVGKALVEMRELDSMASPNYPCFTGLGTNETIVDPDRIKSRMARWSKGELAIYENAKHEIMIEVKDVRDDFFDRSAALFDANL